MEKKRLLMENAYATWALGEDDNSWLVRDKDGTEIARLPSHWDEKMCMTAIRLARMAEKEAYDTGLADGKKVATETLKATLGKTDKHIRFIEEQNERLSEKLEKLIIGQEN